MEGGRTVVVERVVEGGRTVDIKRDAKEGTQKVVAY